MRNRRVIECWDAGKGLKLNINYQLIKAFFSYEHFFVIVIVMKFFGLEFGCHKTLNYPFKGGFN